MKGLGLKGLLCRSGVKSGLKGKLIKGALKVRGRRFQEDTDVPWGSLGGLGGRGQLPRQGTHVADRSARSSSSE